MPTAVTMTYGDYSFSPVPMMKFTKDFIKTPGQENIGANYMVTLTGNLVSYEVGGYINVDALQFDLRTELDDDGKLFHVQCSGSDILKCYPRIKSIQFDTSNDNWVFTCPYTIELEYDYEITEACEFDEGFGEGFDICSEGVETAFSDYISELTETWEAEFADDKSHFSITLPSGGGMTDANPIFLRLNHTVSARGKAVYASGGLTMQAWQQARNAVMPLLGYDSTRISNSGIFNINVTNYGAFNHMRTNSTSETDGTFSVNESWLVCNSGTGIPGQALEDFTIEIRQTIDNDRLSVGVNGSIQGLEQRTYGNGPGDFSITKTKYSSAEDYWAIVRNRLYYRCKYALENGYSGVRALNLNAIASTIGHQPPNGIITYSYDYDNRPSNCVPSALSEVITVTDNNPTDVFASIQVIGRGLGPILQNMNTTTAATREVSVEVVMPAGEGCLTSGSTALLATNPKTAVYNNLIAGVYSDLVSTYGSGNVFKHQDTESWNPKEGRYSRSIGWTMTLCE